MITDGKYNDNFWQNVELAKTEGRSDNQIYCLCLLAIHSKNLIILD